MDLVHPFESAGLGLAPFKCVGVERRIGPLDMGNGISAGAPGQPMGTCQYCGTGIADCYKILSADGKKFIVGSDCVARTYREAQTEVPSDVRKAISQIAAEKREVKRAAREEKLLARVRLAAEALEDHTWLFCGEPHPNAYFAGQGRTYRDYLNFLLNHGGYAGKAEACKLIEQEDAKIAV